MDTKPYLKEMTIMGILSAASVAVPAGMLGAIASKDGSLAIALWNAGPLFIVAASVFCVTAASCFYKERSQLAWLYGQICLTEALNENEAVYTRLRTWLREANSWESWWPYSLGFTFLVTGAVEYLIPFFFLLVVPRWSWPSAHMHILKLCCFYGCAIVAASTAALQYYVLTRYSFIENYWGEFWSDILRFKLRRRPKERNEPLPHDGVYTRLRPSSIHGVGVFAICDIPKGTSVFEPDDDDTVSIPAEETVSLSPEVRRLYEDFCVLEDEVYECPSSLNKLTPAWFLNHSKSPNVLADSSLKFFAIRDIEAGEELTADYGTYSENESDSKLD